MASTQHDHVSEASGQTVHHHRRRRRSIFPSVNVRELIGSCQKLHNRHHSEAISVEVSVEEEVPQEVHVEEGIIQRVFTSLLTNAFKHATTGGAMGATHDKEVPSLPMNPTPVPSVADENALCEPSPPDSPESSPPVPMWKSWAGPPPAPLGSDTLTPDLGSVSGSSDGGGGGCSGSGSGSGGGSGGGCLCGITDPHSSVPPSGELKTVRTSPLARVSRPRALSSPTSLSTSRPPAAPPPLATSEGVYQGTRTKFEDHPSNANAPRAHTGQILIRACLVTERREVSTGGGECGGTFVDNLKIPMPIRDSTASPTSPYVASARTGQTTRKEESASASPESMHSPPSSPSSSPSSFTSKSRRSFRHRHPLRWLRFEVHDSGPGVSPSIQHLIFASAFVAAPVSSSTSFLSKPFRDRQVLSEAALEHRRTTSPADERFAQRQGSGLGLFVVNLCAQDVGGACGFKSANGSRGHGRDREGNVVTNRTRDSEPRLGGSVFWFDVPLDVDEDEPGHGDSDGGTQGGAADGLVGDIGQSLNSVHLGHDPPPSFSMSRTASTYRTSIKGRKQTSGAWSTGSSIATSSSFEDDPFNRTPPIPCGRVLIVDDSVMVQKLLTAAFTRLNYEVETAKNGKEGVEKMMQSEEPYTVVLMDFLMPVMDGITATATFRARELTHGEGKVDEDQPNSADASGTEGSPQKQQKQRQLIVGMSANAEEGDVQAAKAAGMDHFLSKPVKVHEIVDFVAGLEFP